MMTSPGANTLVIEKKLDLIMEALFALAFAIEAGDYQDGIIARMYETKDALIKLEVQDDD